MSHLQHKQAWAQLVLLGLTLGLGVPVLAQDYTMKTLAGNLPNQNVALSQLVLLFSPEAVTSDSAGNIYVADTAGHRVWKVEGDGKTTVVAGTGAFGESGNNGPATMAQLRFPSGLAVDAAGNLYIADRGRHYVRKVDAQGMITAFAGRDGQDRFYGDGRKATDAAMREPRGIAVDTSGNVYIADRGNHRIRKVDTSGIITTVAGGNARTDQSSGAPPVGFAGDGGRATDALLNNPEDVAVDDGGNLYIADTGNSRIRKVDKNGIITTIAGRGATAREVITTAIPSGEPLENLVSQAAAGFASPGPAVNALLSSPSGVSLDGAGNLYISDRTNAIIRVLNLDSGNMATYAGTDPVPGVDSIINPVGTVSNFIATVSVRPSSAFRRGATGDGGTATLARLDTPTRVKFVGGRLLIADTANNRIRQVQSGQITTLIGGPSRYAGDGGPATTAVFNNPWGVGVDSAGNVYIADTGNHRIRKIATDGTITTVAGRGTAGTPSSLSSEASQAPLSGPRGVVSDAGGTLYVADTGNNIVRKISGGNITTVAGVPGCSPTTAPSTACPRITDAGEGGPATNYRLNSPSSVAVDDAGNLYIADTGSNSVKKVTTDGTIRTIAGQIVCTFQSGQGWLSCSGMAGNGGDGGSASRAYLSQPQAIAVDAKGENVYIADTGNFVVRVIDKNGTILPVAGQTQNADQDTTADAIAYNLRMRNPAGVAVDKSGVLYVADTNNNKIRRVELGTLKSRIIAGQDPADTGGSPNASSTAEVKATDGRLSQPTALAVDANGNIFVADRSNGLIRELLPQK
jgi:sugar lactone lactonase YvrE